MNDKMNPFMDMFQKFGENLKIPGADVNAVVKYHRNNIQAMAEVAQVASSGTQAMMSKQREVLEETLAEITDMIQETSKGKDPSQMMSNQMEFAKKSFEATIKNTTEMGEIVRDANMKSYEILKNRVQESIEEIRDGMSMGKSD
ncbi:MAG: TIGR01841 family phasin [Rhizobiaceae bacterium]|nr:TIGR01841 family phasin [Rhizobiaceae bacterium]